ncbi:B3 domain-containing transcription factor VRN1-like [Apium graveolens]|uniref:B3 domain-containing transcription factor VRN1-like n=1 Tax=Apium graveolens TaxID=4045 RepID=UPI003D795458
MASSKSPDLSTKPIRFFKIILSDIGSRSKLMIPRNFARIFGENLKDSILLHAPNGSVWSIDLERHEGGVWLQNGWPEFAKFYSICVGYLLVLEYQGDSRFQLLIFDPSSSEIDYPLASSDKLNSVKLNQMVIDIEDSTSFDDSTSCDDNSSSSGDAVRPCKKMKTNSPHVEAKLQQEAAKEDGDRALASAQAYKSKNPFFIQPMKPSNIGYRRWPSLHVTKTFEEAYENWKNNDKIILQVAGRTWAVYCSLNLGSNHCRISRGWNKFVRDNSLNVCDVCVFELINPSKKVLQVAIFRAAKEKNCGENKRSPRVSEAEEAGVRASVTVRSCKKTSGNSLRVDACRKRPKSRKQNEVGNGEWGEDKALALAKAFISKNPFFITVMHPFHVNGRGTGLYITRGL